MNLCFCLSTKRYKNVVLSLMLLALNNININYYRKLYQGIKFGMEISVFLESGDYFVLLVMDIAHEFTWKYCTGFLLKQKPFVQCTTQDSYQSYVQIKQNCLDKVKILVYTNTFIQIKMIINNLKFNFIQIEININQFLF